MTKISQLTDIGGGLAPNDEFIIRDVSDASTPNKKVTTSGFFVVASALGLTGFDIITAGNVASGTQVRAYASGIAGRVDTTISGITVARTTISGYYENASGVASGVLYPVVTQFDIGTSPNQVPLNQQLGTMAFQDTASVAVGTLAVGGGMSVASGIAFPAVQVTSADANTLDDYEEGTWTPVFYDSAGTNISSSFSLITAAYTKIGTTVVIRCFGVANTTATIREINGLPFATAGFVSGYNSLSFAVFGSGYAVVTNPSVTLSTKDGSTRILANGTLSLATNTNFVCGGTLII